MAQEVLDHAMQTFGAMGMTKELPLQLMASQVRVQRIYEGPERGPPHGHRPPHAEGLSPGDRRVKLRHGCIHRLASDEWPAGG
jgi:hypothetical protein